MDKFALGWSPDWDRLLDERALTKIVRIVAKHKTMYQALRTNGEMIHCLLKGKMLYDRAGQDDLPSVGDSCLVGETFTDLTNGACAFVERVLPRRTFIARRGVEFGDDQVLAANVDFVFIVTSINRDFNINRLRRFVLIAHHGACQPIIVLSKCDLPEGDPVVDAVDLGENRSLPSGRESALHADCRGGIYAALEPIIEELHETFPAIPVIATSSLDGVGIEEVRNCLAPGITAVFVGSSGVGKSSLINALIGSQLQKISHIRADERGRHTTSGSALFFLDGGGMIIDTAGLREVGLVSNVDELDDSLPTVSDLSESCRFGNCTHTTEPGCAVLAALDDGTLSASEFDAYDKLSREIAYNERKNDRRLASQERKKWKRIAIDNRRANKSRGF